MRPAPLFHQIKVNFYVEKEKYPFLLGRKKGKKIPISPIKLEKLRQKFFFVVKLAKKRSKKIRVFLFEIHDL